MKIQPPLIFLRKLAFALLPLAVLFQSSALSRGQERKLTWGISAISLKPAWSGSPSMDDLLDDDDHTVALSQFYRVGGVDRAATPTECRIATSDNALLVVFHCTEADMSFPTSDLFFPNTNREANWKVLHGSPGGCDSWPPFPDEVDFFVQPDPASPSYYQFSATPDGSKHAVNRSLRSGADTTPDEAAAGRNSSVSVTDSVGEFEAHVVKKQNEWLVYFKIPWSAIGGKPASRFGLLPVRTRWRDGEFSSPAAIDFEEWLPMDLCIEADPVGGSPTEPAQTALCRLPSGTLRWQRPAMTPYPDAETRQQIWRMETSLAAPTDTNNLGERLYLTQRWMDLMTQEGFTALPRAWGILSNNLTLAYFRQKVNGALQQNDTARACQLLDTYLGQLDKMSRWWYADGSPGDILKSAWTPVESAESLQVKDNVLQIPCVAGGHRVDLHLSLPATGGVRLYASDDTHFKPTSLLRLKADMDSKSCSIKTADGRIVVNRAPFSISFYDSKGKEVTRIGAGDLAFRFGPDGQVLAFDFRNHLESDESIYGFGEKYDHFNQNGNVLTLWGTDDWVGNGLALRNTTYKLVPVFHSSKGYMIFDDSSYRLRADVGKADPNEYRITQLGPTFDFYVWIGTPENALNSYTALTGRVPLPPKWVFEPWMGRGGGAWQDGPLHDPVAEEENTYNRFAALDIPHSAIYAEGPSANSPDLNQFMASHNIKVLGYFMPAIMRRQGSTASGLKPEEVPIMHTGNPAVERELGYVDFTNPKAMEVCRQYLKRSLDVGVAGSMVDFGDMVPDDAVFYDGKRGDEMHNFYSYAYHKTISALYREKRGDDFILYGRAASPGTQKFVGQFAGDHPSDFDGLRAVLTGGLSLCACGFSSWGSDLGGYFGLPEPAVYMRWFQFGLFSPIMRPHGKATRDPWYFGDAAVTNYKFLAWTRENLLNYTYNAATVAHETGVPIMRSMAVAYPEEAQLAATREEYMFGEDLLVAPVLNEDTFKVVSFPPGSWTSLWDGKTVSGPVELKVDAPLDTIPAYLRPGAVIPLQLSKELEFGQSMTPGRVTALLVTPPNQNEIISPLNDQNQHAKVTARMAGNTLSWKLEDRPETEFLLVYGVTDASQVKVDGKVLSKAAATEINSTSAAWMADTAHNRLVIHLPSSRRTRTVEVSVNPDRK